MSEIKRNDWPELYEAPSGENSKKYIFISYSHEDAGIVYQDLKTLAANGARIWYDRAMHVGQNWIERARNKIQDKNCAAVLYQY
jgi:predicted nucleotide-binding protein